MTTREKAVLDALLGVHFDGVEQLRDQAASVKVADTCRCGCPSIDFYNEPGVGMHVSVNAAVEGSSDGLFLYTVGGRLGGIEWVGVSDGDPADLLDPILLTITPV